MIHICEYKSKYCIDLNKILCIVQFHCSTSYLNSLSKNFINILLSSTSKATLIKSNFQSTPTKFN